jgi:hypothetical protein
MSVLKTNLWNDDVIQNVGIISSRFDTVKNCAVDVTWNVDVGTIGSCNICTSQGQCSPVAHIPGYWNQEMPFMV